MLGSLTSHEEHQEESRDLYRHRAAAATGVSPPAAHMRQLLINCAELISQSDFAAASRLLHLLLNTCAPCGDSTDRLAQQFAAALSIRLNRLTFPLPPSSSSSSSSASLPSSLLHSSYLYLNQITPFIRFCHLTANQAILEAADGHPSLHILDLDTMQGVQWPPLMQAIAERADPPAIRITGAGHDLDALHRTGDRLEKFAQSLGLDFHFHPLHLSDPSQIHLHLHSLPLLPNEALAVNCVLFLHKLLVDESGRSLQQLLRAIKAMSPKVVTVAEREANHNHPVFFSRFLEALEYYGAIFDSLEATQPPTSRERLSVEQIWFGREIADVVAEDGGERRERHERFERWVEIMRGCGFSNVPLSPFALSQAKLLLRLHYPSEGYQLQLLRDTSFLGWQNRPLFSISSWN